MTDRWDRVTILFGAARALDPPLRAKFLDLACEHDSEIRTDVEALLASDADDGFLMQPPWTLIGEAIGKAADPLAPGELLKERYRVDERFSEGGQAIVYRGTDQVLGRPVVIKVMRAGTRHNRMLKSRFEQEMTALSRVDHPGVVGIIDVGELPDSSPFLVVQFINGVSLRELLATGPLNSARAAIILRQLGAALSAAHAAGVVHRDLKPENILIQRLGDGTEAVKLIDFGIAKVDRSAAEPGATTITIAGTVRYMAPEQFQGEHSAACDVYALSLVACEMLTGQPDVRALPARFDAPGRRLIESALALRPDARPRDVRHWAETLADSLADRGPNRRRLLMMAGAGAVALAASLFVGRTLALSSGEPVRIIEKRGAFDPVDEGFRTHNEISGGVVDNASRDGYEAWRVRSPRMGHYYQDLTSAQKKLALDRGWSFSAKMRVEEGMVFAVIDFTGVGKRFDINLFSEESGDVVRLNTQLSPTMAGMQWRMPHDGVYHLYELRFDPGLQVADLWVDGERRLTGYRGHNQYQTDGDLLFGATAYKSKSGVGSFQLVRFEIHP